MFLELVRRLTTHEGDSIKHNCGQQTKLSGPSKGRLNTNYVNVCKWILSPAARQVDDAIRNANTQFKDPKNICLRLRKQTVKFN